MLVRSTRAKRKAYDYRPWVYILRLLENVSSGIDAHTPAHTPRTRMATCLHVRTSLHLMSSKPGSTGAYSPPLCHAAVASHGGLSKQALEI